MKKVVHPSHKLPLSRQYRQILEKRRLRSAKLFEKGKTKSEVARICGVSHEASRQWYEMWKKKGIEGLKSKGRPGPKSRLTQDKKEKVKEALLKGPQSFGFATNIWTLKRITQVIKKVAKVRFHPGYVWYILGSMGWSCQKPKIQSKQRNQAVINSWKRNNWPEIKKKSKN